MTKHVCSFCGYPLVRWCGRELIVHTCADIPRRIIPVPANDDDVHALATLIPAVKVTGGAS